MRPNAANRVSFGLNPVIAGTSWPTPARNSRTPVKMNRSCGTAENQALSGALGSTGPDCNYETLPKPVMLKKAPHNTWKVQSAVFMARACWLVRSPRFTTFEPPEAASWGL